MGLLIAHTTASIRILLPLNKCITACEAKNNGDMGVRQS